MPGLGSTVSIFLFCVVWGLFAAFSLFAQTDSQNNVDPIHSKLYPHELIERISLILKSEAVEVRELAACATDLVAGIDQTVRQLHQGNHVQAASLLDVLERETVRWKTLRTKWPLHFAGKEDEGPFLPSRVFLEEIQLSLERHVTLWRMAVQAELAPTYPVTRLFEKNVADIQRLKAKTLEVETYFLGKAAASQKETDEFGSLWCDYLDTRSFIGELEACERSTHGPNRRVSTLVSQLPVTMLISFSDRANVILTRLNDPELSGVQQAYLGADPVVAWKEELRDWRADTVSTATLLQAVERFESTGGMSDMENLFRLATRQSFSLSPHLRRLGAFTRELYGLPNVKIYISKSLINNHLPQMKPEVGAFREVIQGQPTQGRRHADPDLTVSFQPDENRLRFALDLDVSVETSSRSNAFATTLFNTGQAHVEARKEVELTEFGFLLASSDVRVVNNRLQLRRVQTDFDRIPLLSSLVRGVVKNQYDSKIAGARSETQQKIARQVRTRLDNETDDRFKTLNERYREFRRNSMSRFDLFIEKKDSKTEEEWLLTSWAIRSQDSLSANTPAPETLPGSFADLKVHESVINMIVGKLQLDGKSGTVGEIRREIAEKFNRPQIDEAGENDNVQIAFADYNPVVVRFSDGKAELRISIKSLRIRRNTYRNFVVLVRYLPESDAQGKIVLKRDGVIRLLGCPRIGDQVTLRTAFGIIFPEKRVFPLTPKFLTENPEFDYLRTGHCRLEKGWFTIALVAKDDPDGLRQATGTANTRQVRR